MEVAEAMEMETMGMRVRSIFGSRCVYQWMAPKSESDGERGAHHVGFLLLTGSSALTSNRDGRRSDERDRLARL